MSAKASAKANEGASFFSLVASVAVIGLAFYFGRVLLTSARFTHKRSVDSLFISQKKSAVETFLVAYRHAETLYAGAVAGCSAAVPFNVALKQGSGCDKTLEVIVFVGDANDPGLQPPALYRYVGSGCKIEQTSSSCQNGLIGFLKIDGAQQFGDFQLSFSMTAVDPVKHLVEFTIETTDSNKQVTRQAFGMQTSLPDSAHLEADGRVTDENPDRLSPCPGLPWTTYQLYDPVSRKCTSFTQAGSGTGLAFYNGRFFGFRPVDGQVIDLEGITSAAQSYMVGEDGTAAGSLVPQPEFPPYDKATLMNVDDITLIQDQVYTVSQLGPAAQIGLQVNQGGKWSILPICPLGALGWAQSYVGITALSWSDTLAPPKPELPDRDRLATFFLKTDSGDLLTAVVQYSPALHPDPNNGGAQTHYACSVFKDQTLQQVEYKRTYGFDRTGLLKPYYLY